MVLHMQSQQPLLSPEGGSFIKRTSETRQLRMKALRETAEGHHLAVERLLGYRLDSTRGLASNPYHLLPDQHVDRTEMTAKIQQMQTLISKAEAKVLQTRIYPTVLNPRNGCTVEVTQAENEVKQHKWALMCYLTDFKPIDAAAFHKQLAPELDGLLAALRELRELEIGTFIAQ